MSESALLLTSPLHSGIRLNSRWPSQGWVDFKIRKSPKTFHKIRFPTDAHTRMDLTDVGRREQNYSYKKKH